MNALPLRRQATAPAGLGRAATVALYDELELHPKPGLVSFVDSGSHDDMDAGTFMRSLFSLRRYFRIACQLGAEGAPFEALEAAGIEAEARMLAATGGVNTHRGAVFSLGLLCASAGLLWARGSGFSPQALRETLRSTWGPSLAARSRLPRTSHGRSAARLHGLRGVEDEARDGFPVLFEVAVPRLLEGLARGLPPRLARLDTFFAILAELDDTNLVHRGGLQALHAARAMAREFLAAGGSARSDGIARAEALHARFVERRWSPGGTADVLAAACWVERLVRMR